MPKILLRFTFFVLAEVLFALDPSYDLHKINPTAFIDDQNNNMQSGQVSATNTITYYSNPIKVTISAAKKDPNSIYVFFQRGSSGSADLEAYLHEVLDFYYSDAFAMETHIGFDSGEVEVDYRLHFRTQESLLVYAKMSPIKGLRGFGVTRGKDLRADSDLSEVLFTSARESKIANKIDWDKITTDCVYFKNDTVKMANISVPFSTISPGDLGNGEKKYLTFTQMVRGVPTENGEFRIVLRLLTSDPDLYQSVLASGLTFHYPGWDGAVSGADLLKYSAQDGYSVESHYELTYGHL